MGCMLRKAGGPWAAGLLFFSLILPLSGCAGGFTRSLGQHPGPERVFLDTVPFQAQEEYQCGPAALGMLLDWSGVEVAPALLTSQVYSPSLQGSLQPSIIAAARRHGRIAYPLSGSAALFTELAAGHPVLVLQNLGLSWFPRWHYAVAMGYDRGEELVFLHSGLEEASPLPARVFANTWARGGSWGLLVLPPERLPATATEETWLTAALGLEQAGQWPAASTAYGAALSRWPESFAAWMALGNSRYTLDDFAGAVEAFRRAAQLQPGSGPALNNLALALAATGQRQEALAVIRQAMALGGPMQEEFLLTQEEILRSGAAE